ncbi:MAG: hypothetical protein MRERV_16c014 [Mycoplasmataceae bacterium RV_VA103A]|nr:MAG: hypothetical protein MRERV_16c014 [Mycoplasmataceae bacterium RV_VA103A]
MTAQEYLEKNWSDKNITQINLSSDQIELTGDLIVEDYPLLKKIELKNHQLNSLTVINCPNLQHVNVRDNGLTILDLSKVKVDMDKKGVENEVKEIIASQNNLTILDLTNCQQVQELLVADNADLKELKNLNQTFLKNFNLINTQTDLDKEKQTLKQKNDYLFDIIKGVNEMGKDRGLALSDLIVSPEQNEEAIKRLLIKTRNSWVEYLESKDPDIGKKKPLLHLSFQFPHLRRKAQEILIYISGVIVGNYTYDELLKEWNGESEDYQPIYDFDLALFSFINHVQVQKPLMASWEKQPQTSPLIFAVKN